MLLLWESRRSSFLLLSTFPRSPAAALWSGFSSLQFAFGLLELKICKPIAFLGLISFANFLCGHVENGRLLGQTVFPFFSLFRRDTPSMSQLYIHISTFLWEQSPIVAHFLDCNFQKREKKCLGHLHD